MTHTLIALALQAIIAIPSGNWWAGAAAGAPGSQYMVTGWWRATTGSNHVLNTDWFEMRTPTGT